jgi:hypothetical protein
MRETIEKIGIGIAVVGVTAAIFFAISGKKVEEHKPIRIKIDAQKIGHRAGDFSRKFMKGFRDTTTIKPDTTKLIQFK